MSEPDTYQAPEHGWACFHCGETFTAVKAARLHFGNDITDEPGCVLKLKGDDQGLLALVRYQYAELDRYRMEDQPIMRELYALGSTHARAQIEAEQRGYDRGLKDGQIYLASKPLPAEVVAAVEQDLKAGISERECARVRGISHGKIRGVSRAMKMRANDTDILTKEGTT